ncbi:toll/interleukin-1 receptor domain-containing protein [Vibrio parahaemolyticus]|nr:toll/interleukin-1 receptor domain-containing protein [Vibrio parahaemolyticus]
MEVFISWSGDKSRKAAEVLRDWLPSVIQMVKPYFTPKDIDKGQRWSSDIAGKLELSQFGIILLTRDNINAPWILFEAGALSKNLNHSRVCPILLDLKPADLSGPLVQFQATPFNKEEIRKLVGAVNDSMGDNGINEKTLDNSFEKWWPDLERELDQIINDDTNVTTLNKPVRTDRELLEEVLRLARRQEYPSFKHDNSLFEKLSRKPVSYDENARTLTVWFRDNSPYEIEVERFTSGSELLDFVLQINGKGLCSPEHIKAFLDSIEEICDRYFKSNAQGVFCPGGYNKSVEWPSD